MRTTSISALALSLLTPLFVLAQPTMQGPVNEQQVTRSPLFWYWLVAFAIAVVVFIWASVAISRRRGPPRVS